MSPLIYVINLINVINYYLMDVISSIVFSVVVVLFFLIPICL